MCKHDFLVFLVGYFEQVGWFGPMPGSGKEDNVDQGHLNHHVIEEWMKKTDNK